MNPAIYRLSQTRGASSPNVNNVIPELPALLLVSRVGSLIDGDDHPLVGGGEQADNRLWSGVHIELQQITS